MYLRAGSNAASGQQSLELPTFSDAHQGKVPNTLASQLAGALPTTLNADHSTASLTNHLLTKIVTRIENLEFVEIYELLQDTWLPDATTDGSSTQGITLRLPRRLTPVSDISVWVECFGLMASVLCARYPASAANIWAYLRRIVRCARTFDGNGWVDYDRLYRRHAAATRSLSWAIED